MRYFNAMNVAREQRLSAVFSSIPDVLWYVLIVGALGTIIFMWMLHMDLVPQLLLSGITAFFLGIMIFLIYALDHPLRGAVSVGAEPFQSVYDLAMKWEDQGGRATFASLGTGELNGIYYPAAHQERDHQLQVQLPCQVVADRWANNLGLSAPCYGRP